MWTVVLNVALVTTCSSFLCSLAASTSSLHIGALLPVAENPRFFNKDLEFICEIAVDHVNESPDILPNHTLALELQDSMCDVGLAIYELSNLLQAGKETMVALIGEGCSTATQPIARATPLWNLVLFNFLSTSPALSNTDIYPSFYPVLPSENGLNPARVAVMKQNRWRKAIILIQSSEIFDLNAENLRQSMVASGFETPKLLLLPESHDYSHVVQQVKETGIRILFGLFYEEVGRQVICEFWKNGISAPDYVWHFVGWYQSPYWYLATIGDKEQPGSCSREQLLTAVNGHFTYDVAQVRADTDIRLATGKTVQEIANTLSRKKSTSFQNVSDVFRQYSAYGYDCVLALGLSLHRVAERLAISGEISRLNNFTYNDDILIKMIRNVTKDETFVFEGLTGPVRVATLFSLEEQQRRAAAHVKIYYNTRDQTRFIALVTGNDTKHFSSIPWTTTNSKPPHDSTPDVEKYSNVGFFVAMVVLAALGLVIDLVLFVFTQQQRNHRIMKKAVPRINRWLILGTAGVFLAIIFYGFDGQFFAFSDPSSLHLCFARIVALALGFTFAFGTILVKTIAELCKLQGFKCIGGINQQVFLRNLEYLLIGILLLLDIILLIMWRNLDSFTKSIQVLNPHDDDKIRYIRYKCSVGDSWANGFAGYKLIMLLATIILVCVHIKTVSTKDKRHSPYKDLIVSSCGMAFSFAAFGLVFIDDPGLEYALVSLVLIVMSYLILGSMFALKFLGVLMSSHNKDNVDETDANGARIKELHDLYKVNKNQKELLKRIQQQGGLTEQLAAAVSEALQPVGNLVPSEVVTSTASRIHKDVEMW